MKDIRELIERARQSMDQSSTHDGLTNCVLISKAGEELDLIERGLNAIAGNVQVANNPMSNQEIAKLLLK